MGGKTTFTRDFFITKGAEGGRKAARQMTKDQLRARAMKGVKVRARKTRKVVIDSYTLLDSWYPGSFLI
jgi:hypothetical protein